jgi:hypothetical protein
VAQGVALYDRDQVFTTLIGERAKEMSAENSRLLMYQLDYFERLAVADSDPQGFAAAQTDRFIAMWDWSATQKARAIEWFTVLHQMRLAQPMDSTDKLVESIVLSWDLKDEEKHASTQGPAQAL